MARVSRGLRNSQLCLRDRHQASIIELEKATEIEAFVVDRIKDIGRDPALLQETLRAAEEDRQRERPELDKEARMLTAELATSRAEARKLVAALAAGGDMPSVTARLSELDERATQLETRLGEVQAKIAAIDRGHIDPEQTTQTLAQFNPVWEALIPRERASVLQLLIEGLRDRAVTTP
jgi:site-specific DNA recombinase